MKTKLIALGAVDAQWGCGYQNHLLFNNSEDLSRFARLTQAHIIVMGRKTLESLPQGNPLEGRTNIVISTTLPANYKGCVVVRSIDEAQDFIAQSNDSIAWIIGGSEIWSQMLDVCDACYITYHHATASHVDTYFPENLDLSEKWIISSIEGTYETEDSIKFDYRIYRRNI